MKKEEKNLVMENIISLAKRRGFIFQGSEIYGGLAGTWDYAPFGVALKNNIKRLWWKRFVDDRDDMYGMDAAILMNQNVWKASGHVGGFADPLVECGDCKKRFRVDHLIDEKKHKTYLEALVNEGEIKVDDPEFIQAQKYVGGYIRKYLSMEVMCPGCSAKKWGEARQFNMMFKTSVGATESEDSISYLRPETAQGMFVNFKNIMDTFHPRLPFGMAQIGKAFRNEIAPRDFIFRTREFEQMEIEYFVDPRNEKAVNAMIDTLYTEQLALLADIGLDAARIHKIEIAPADRAHYSKRSIDTEFDFPFGQKELLGLAYRTDYDLKAHTNASGTDLSYYDEESKERFIPHCIEPTFGLDRLVLAVLSQAYTEDELGGEKRVYLKLAPSVAPIKIAVFPLLKNKEALTGKAQELYKVLRKEFGAVEYDETGSIGKRYRRQDEIGTPFCVTVDFDTIEKDGNPVTVRNRDTGTQERIALKDLVSFMEQKLGK